MKERRIIAAICRNNEIGINGNMIFWIKPDLIRFRTLTLGNIVIMGRKTYEAIGSHPLPKRNNIVITSKNIDTHHENLWCVHTIDEAFELAETLEGDKIYVIGGAQIYKETIDKVDYLDITHIESSYGRADAYFPDIHMKYWDQISQSDIMYDDGTPFSFVTYKRIK